LCKNFKINEPIFLLTLTGQYRGINIINRGNPLKFELTSWQLSGQDPVGSKSTMQFYNSGVTNSVMYNTILYIEHTCTCWA